MLRKMILAGIILSLFLTGIVVAQNDDDDEITYPRFQVVQEIGRALPRKMIYDPNFDQYGVVDAYGRLVIMDSQRFDVQHTLYQVGSYNDLQFSNDGRWLALAIGRRIELWDTQSGERVAMIDGPSEAIRVTGPLKFTEDDEMLFFETTNPAPRSIRQFEGQTLNYPWVWHLPSARNEAQSPFPRAVEAQPFFDYPFGFALGPDKRIVAALQSRLHVIDATTQEVLYDIRTDRWEQDPLNVWFSARDNQIYVRPVSTNSLIQVDTQRGVLVEIPLGDFLTQADLELIGNIELSEQAQVIGEPASRSFNRLVSRFLGSGYRSAANYANTALTVTLVDLIVPPATTGDNIRALIFVFDEDEQEGFFRLTSGGTTQLVLSPDEQTLLARVNSGGEEIIRYNIDSGENLGSIVPSLREIGFYSRVNKNRVLAYSLDGSTYISDFQRYDALNDDVLAEDLRYSRNFDRFFFAPDNEIVTLSGNEWRVWDMNTADVKRREVTSFEGRVVATSSDGYRWLTRFGRDERDEEYGIWAEGGGMQVTDYRADTRDSVTFEGLAGRSIQDVYWNDAWDKFLVVHGPNQYHPHYPSNDIAMYSLTDGFLWHMAGADLPPADNRSYGWVDNDTVYITGSGDADVIPARVFGMDFALSGLPQCVVEAFPDQVESWQLLWERLNYYERTDNLVRLSQVICANLPSEPSGVTDLLIPTATPLPVSPTPIVIRDVPVCLTARFPNDAEGLAAAWEDIIAEFSAEEIAEAEDLICDALAEEEIRNQSNTAQDDGFTMMIDATTGERASGSFALVPFISRPLYLVREIFEDVMSRNMGTAILSPDARYIAASNLPGELVIYELPVPYEEIMAVVTQTAVAEIATQDLIRVLPSATPTYNPIGTARPTLTPTVEPTVVSPPVEVIEQPLYRERSFFCPSDELYTVDNAPDSYTPTGRIVAPVEGDFYWAIEPEDGRRYTDEDIPLCTDADNCYFSPDREWILLRDEIIGRFRPTWYLVRPDGTDRRLLFEDYGEDIDWSGNDAIQYPVTLTLTDENGREYNVRAEQRDIINTDANPDPWIPEVVINEIPTNIQSRQPGGPWVIVTMNYKTGISVHSKYYLYNIETGEDIYFARDDERGVSTFWHPNGERLFWKYSGGSFPWYQIDMDTMQNRELPILEGGVWSPDGRYRIDTTRSSAQPLRWFDSETGETRTFCIPEYGLSTYSGTLIWSPDNRYVALQTELPEDENEDVGDHILILDVETGVMVDLFTGAGRIVTWSREPGEYGGNE